MMDDDSHDIDNNRKRERKRERDSNKKKERKREAKRRNVPSRRSNRPATSSVFDGRHRLQVDQDRLEQFNNLRFEIVAAISSFFC